LDQFVREEVRLEGKIVGALDVAHLGGGARLLNVRADVLEHGTLVGGERASEVLEIEFRSLEQLGSGGPSLQEIIARERGRELSWNGQRRSGRHIDARSI